jgi:hypothetical protein
MVDGAYRVAECGIENREDVPEQLANSLVSRKTHLSFANDFHCCNQHTTIKPS